MAITPYTPMEFNHNDVITKDMFDRMQTNLQWLKDNIPTAMYQRDDRPAKGLPPLIQAGRVAVPVNKKKDTALIDVKFPKPFAPGCQPHVATSIVHSHRVMIFLKLIGGGGKLYPTATGFKADILMADDGNPKNDYIGTQFWIHWMAVGYGEKPKR